jgi:hypothetical protein
MEVFSSFLCLSPLEDWSGLSLRTSLELGIGYFGLFFSILIFKQECMSEFQGRGFLDAPVSPSFIAELSFMSV